MKKKSRLVVGFDLDGTIIDRSENKAVVMKRLGFSMKKKIWHRIFYGGYCQKRRGIRRDFFFMAIKVGGVFKRSGWYYLGDEA